MDRFSTTLSTPRALPPAEWSAPSSSSSSSSSRRPPTLPTSLFILPFTSAEWSKAIADVKKDYVNRRFRPCVARCHDILGRLRDKTVIQPVYLIYLHFYAASSQESMAFALHHSSPHRLGLLAQAKDHYAKASQLVTTAAAIAATTNSSSSSHSYHRRTSSSGSGLPIPVDSPASVRAPSGLWTPIPHSESSSRATSISSVEDAYAASASSSSSSSSSRARRRKPRSSCQSAVVEPPPPPPPMISRPDSPTLGLSPLAGSTFQDLLNAMPSPPPKPSSSSSSSSTTTSTTPTAAEPDDSDVDRDTSFTTASSSSPPPPHPPHHLPPLQQSSSSSSTSRHPARRFSALLVALQTQITRHLSFVEADLAAAHHPPPPTAINTGLHDDERRSMELQARIERLRAGGWQRRRFDASRYQDLRENAMADIYS